jgi:uncharacterized membrane protein
MRYVLNLGRPFYGIGIAAIGVHQLITRAFRPDILPPFPAWAHRSSVFAILAGVALMVAGSVMAMAINTRMISAKRVGLYLAFSFLVLIITCHLPYILVMSPDGPMHLQVWFGVGEALAYCGGALVLAGSFSNRHGKVGGIELLMERLIPFGPALYAILIFIFGCSHFVYAAFVSTMVPEYFGAAMFWTYFVGVALIGAALAIILRIWVKIVALLLAIMLFIFFLLFHVPDAIANPSAGGGNEIVRAIICVLFCGIALMISATSVSKRSPVS